MIKQSIFVLFKSATHFDEDLFVHSKKILNACAVDKRETILENLTLSVAFVHGKFEYLMHRRK